jgi:hypothetical protein
MSVTDPRTHAQQTEHKGADNKAESPADRQRRMGSLEASIVASEWIKSGKSAAVKSLAEWVPSAGLDPEWIEAFKQQANEIVSDDGSYK